MREFTRLSQNKDECSVLVSTGIDLMKNRRIILFLTVPRAMKRTTTPLILGCSSKWTWNSNQCRATLSPGKEPIYYLDFRLDGLQSPPDSMEKTQRRSWAWNPYCLFVHPVYYSL